MNKMKFGSLFAGIGGIDLGLERAGMTCAWQVEIDPYCQKVLAKHWPEVKRYEDIREVGADNLVPVDLICGGFPCQPHSFAGKREGSADERDLWGEMFRVICEVKPRWVLAENVPGLLSSEAGRFFGRVLRDLASVGYDVEWESLPAAAFGAPHIRERVFVLAHSNGTRGGGTGRDAIHEERRTCEDWREGVQETAERINGVAVSNVEPASSYGGHTSGREDVADTERLRRNPEFWKSEGQQSGERWQARSESTTYGGSWWSVEPDVGRVANGVPSRVDRLRSLGNAVVPQVAEWIGKRILEAG